MFQYIDETATSCTRSTRLNEPDVVLSADQNDSIQSSALKQIQGSRFAVDGNKIEKVTQSLASSSSGAMGAAAPVPAEAAGEGDAEEAEDDEDDYEAASLDPQPFQSLFSRLARPDAKKRAAPGPTSSAPAKKAKQAKPSHPSAPVQRNKARKVGKVGEPAYEAPGDLFGVERLDLTSDQGKEDATIIESYINQFKQLKHLDAPGSDDQTFGPWSRTRIAKLQELKTGLIAKKKSLKRRTTDASELNESLEEIQEKITDVMAFMKKLAAGNSEGRELYDDLLVRIQEDLDYQPSNGVWKRCIRGVAFEDGLV